jgi:hypothetical protein
MGNPLGMKCVTGVSASAFEQASALVNSSDASAA